MSEEHAVLVHIVPPAGEDFAIDDIEDQLEDSLDAAGVGELDGNEVDLENGSATLYMYGQDADALWNSIESIVRSASLPAGSYVTKQYGEPGAREVRIDLGSSTPDLAS